MPVITAEEMWINRRTQIGLETTAGTDVAAPTLLESVSVEFDPNIDIQKYRAMGRRYPRLAAVGNEYTAWTFAGKPTFDEMTYFLIAGLSGVIAPVTQGTLGKKYKTPMVLTGPQLPQTFSIQQGTTTRAQKVNFGVETDFTLKITDTTNDINGAGFAHAIQDSATLTASPTTKAFNPIAKPMWGLYIDTSAFGLGVTQMRTPLDIEFNWGSVQSMLYAINRTGAYKNAVDTEPKATIKVIMEGDAQGMGLLPAVRLGSLQYIRLNAIGAQIEQTFIVDLGAPTGGTFTLTYGAAANVTAGLAFNANGPTTVQTALQGLTGVGANATVTGAASPYTVTFSGPLASVNNIPTYDPILGTQLTGFSASGALLTPQNLSSSNPVTPTAYLCQMDMACICTAIGKLTNKGEVLSTEYDFEVFEDPNWINASSGGGAGGTAAVFQMINTLASL